MDAAQVLQVAIDREREAYELYRQTAETAEDPAVRKLLLNLASDERRHRQMLEGLNPAEVGRFTAEQHPDRQIGEYLQAPELGDSPGLQQTLAFAIKKEQQARELYARMSLGLRDARLSELFHELANMERGHKARLEEMYETHFLRDN